MRTKGDQTKEYIVKKAAELFNIYGYHRCSLSDIMKATELKKGGIYNHFKNKDEIALAAFDYSMSRVAKRFREKLSGVKSSSEKLEAIIDFYESYIADPFILGGCPIANTAVDATDTHPELKQKAVNGFQFLEDYITIKIDEGKTQGEFKADVDSREVANFMISCMEGAVIMARINKDRRTFEISAKQMRTLIKTQVLVN